jgi:hypothetical protein
MPDFTPRKALDLVEDMRSGRIQVPTFQRDFVWKRSDVEKLLDSIRREIPIGTITLWEPGLNHRGELFEPFFKNVKIKVWDSIEPQPDSEGEGDTNWFFSVSEATGINPSSEIAGPIYGVIDGRQRLTTLMMLFGRVAFSNAQHKHGGVWALRLNADLFEDDEPFQFLDWKEQQQYTTIADWVKVGLFPLWLHSKRDDFIDALDNPSNFPDSATHIIARKKWRRNLSAFCDIISNLSVAAYILDSKVTLDKVCVIFETLNTRGIRVGVYDIVQARLMGLTLPGGTDAERYNLKKSVRQLHGTTHSPYMRRWFDENEGQGDVIVCQIAMARRMGLVLASGDERGLASFKGPDLIYKTTIEDYRACIEGDPSLQEQFARDFETVTGGVDGRSRCPYPILFSQYSALRWAQSSRETADLKAAIDDAFRVFFWRAIFAGRYDQGFLTRSVSDIRAVWNFVSAPENMQRYSADRVGWWSDYGVLLKSKRPNGLELDKPFKEMLVASIRDGAAGAAEKALTVLLYTRGPIDLKTGVSLRGMHRKDVEMHHIFPSKWVQKNRSNSRKLLGGRSALIPLSEASNLEWLDNEPRQQLAKWGVGSGNVKPDWDFWQVRMESVFINEHAFNWLVSQDSENVENFIRERTETLWRACDELCATKTM